MADSDIVKQQAREWVDRLNSGAGLEGAWRLQRIEKRSRVAVEGAPARELPVRIRRFAKGIPVNFVDEAIRYLISIAPYEDIVYNGTRLEGAYAPTRTWWERDDQAVVDRGQMRENTYTIYQDLIDRDHADLEEFDAGGNCSEEVSMRYEYDTFTIEDVPPGGQGVTRSIQAISRNEDGTFNYAVVTRTAKTAVGDEQTVKCDEFQTVSQQSYQNLYGTEGHYTDESGAAIDLPKPCEDKETGTLIEVQVRKNDDCTYDATVTKTVAKTDGNPAEVTKQKTLRGVTETVTQRNVTDDSTVVTNIGDKVQVERNPDGTVNRSDTHAVLEPVGDIGSQCEKTIFEHTHSDMENVAERPAKEATEASGGVIHEVSARATEEGTWDVTDKVTTEQPVASAQHIKRKTLRGVTETIVDRNVTDDTVTVTNVGDEVRVEKTPGGLVNRTETTVDKTAEDIDLGDQCQKTVFEHQQRKDTVVPNKPADIHADDAGDGKTHQRTLRQTEEGSWEVSDVTTEELENNDAQVEKRKTLRGVTETHVHRNVQDNSVTVTNIGDRVSVERTPGGRYNRTVTSVSPESVGDTGTTCQKTIFEHEHTDLSNESEKPSIDVPAASGGVIHEKSARATEEGTWDVVDKTTTELEVSSAVHSKKKTLRGVTETTVDRNVNNSDVTVTNIGDEVRVEKTPGGKYNRTVTTMSDEAVGTTGKGCSITPSVHTDTEISNVPNGSQPEPQHQTSEVNVEKSVEIRRTEEGTWDVTNRTTVHQPWGEQTIATADNSSQTVEIHAFQNLTEVPTMTSGEGQMITASASRNNVGSFDGNFRVVTGKPWGEALIATADNESQTVEIHAFQNLTAVPTMTAGQGESISASASRNELGLFDGNFRKVIGKPWGEQVIATAENESQTVEIHAFQNLTAVPSMVASQGQSISANASRNELGLFDGNFRVVTGKPWGEATIATATSPARDIEIHAFQNLSAVPTMTAATGEDISANAHRNELGLFDGGFTKTKYKPVTAISTSSTAVDIVTTTVERNSTNSSPSASNGEAHATPDEHGTYSTTVSEHSPQPVSIGPVTWDSTVETPHAILNYSHSLYVFRNLSTPPTPSGAGEVSCSISINNFGLVDGHITTKTLVSWTLKEGGGGGSQSSFAYYRYTFVNGRQYKQRVHGTTYTIGNGPSASMIGDRQVSGGGVTQAYVCDPWEPV